MQIIVKTLTGRKHTFDFEPRSTILQIKEALQEKEGINVPQIKLLHAGKSLDDAATIESAKIEAGTQLHMVLALRGGAA